MELLQVSRQGAQAIQRSAFGSPFASKATLEGRPRFRLPAFRFGSLQCLDLARLSELTLGIPASSSHVTRLSRDPSVAKGSEGPTEECLRASPLLSSVAVRDARSFCGVGPEVFVITAVLGARRGSPEGPLRADDSHPRSIGGYTSSLIVGQFRYNSLSGSAPSSGSICSAASAKGSHAEPVE
jgi:hypothetical protein